MLIHVALLLRTVDHRPFNHALPRDSFQIMFEKMKLEKEEGRGREPLGSADATQATEPRPPPGETPTPAPTQEDREGDALRARAVRLNERLRKLNSYSSLLNIATLMALTWHLVYLAQRISTPC